MNNTIRLFVLGQSIWYDNIQRSLLKNGQFAEMITRGEIRGVTSNPSIFKNAITKSQDYDGSLQKINQLGLSPEAVFFDLAVEDIQEAADLFLPLYEQSQAGDGYVSLEVSPFLADDAEATLIQAKELWQRVNRSNLMIKIPATKAGLPAITEAIAAGINVNVTLIFSLERYAEVMDAYLKGLENRAEAGLPLDHIASVASFFVSRVDTNVDAKLQKLVEAGSVQAQNTEGLFGKAAIANARLAYKAYQEVFTSERFLKLKAQGARVQRPLWASTSTKNPKYRDVIYVEELIGPDTVNTVPPNTLLAFLDHGQIRPSLEEDLEGAQKTLDALQELGISMKDVTYQLEIEGVAAFADAFKVLLQAIETRLADGV